MLQLKDILTKENHDNFIAAVNGDSKFAEKEAIEKIIYLLKDFFKSRLWKGFKITILPDIYGYRINEHFSEYANEDVHLNILNIAFDWSDENDDDNYRMIDVWYYIEGMFEDYVRDHDFWIIDIHLQSPDVIDTRKYSIAT
tara:strand:- start:11 stop:433 length:423 start_codon:yes stop_codon:yes gene_type:complete